MNETNQTSAEIIVSIGVVQMLCDFVRLLQLFVQSKLLHYVT